MWSALPPIERRNIPVYGDGGGSGALSPCGPAGPWGPVAPLVPGNRFAGKASWPRGPAGIERKAALAGPAARLELYVEVAGALVEADVDVAVAADRVDGRHRGSDHRQGQRDVRDHVGAKVLCQAP